MHATVVYVKVPYKHQPHHHHNSYFVSSIEPFVMSSIQNEEILVKIGPRGDLSSRNTEWDESFFGNVSQILITHGRAVNSIQMVYELNGMTALAHRHGGDGDNFDSIKLESWECITSISGHYGPLDQRSTVVVRSLTISTSRTTYGPFGREEGNPFCFNMHNCELSFGGFHGRSNGSYLCALGVQVKTTAKHHFKPDPPRLRLTSRVCSSAETGIKI